MVIPARKKIMDSGVALWGFLGIGAIALFSFLAVAAWSDYRHRERVAYYNGETVKKIVEMSPDAAATALEYLREQERKALRRQRGAIKLGGLVTAAVGVGIMVFLRSLIPDEPVYVGGLIPLLVGVALLAYAYFLAPQIE
jgi:hypothetical protein